MNSPHQTFGTRAAGHVEHDINDPQLVTDESFQRLARASEERKLTERSLQRHSIHVAEAVNDHADLMIDSLTHSIDLSGKAVFESIDDLTTWVFALVAVVGIIAVEVGIAVSLVIAR